MIKTRHRRIHHSRYLGEITVEHVYVDRPGSIETWDENAAKIAREFSKDPCDVHLKLMQTFPQYYGLQK